MKGKKNFYCELAYVFGILILAFGNALMERADFGMSMVVAPAYIIHLKVKEFLPFFSFGMSGYVFQAALLVILSIVVRKVRKSFFLSFVTAFIYGFVLDFEMSIIALLPFDGLVWRIVFFAIGLVLCSSGVALLFHTYLPPEAYDLFVKEISQRFNISISKSKTAYDVASLALGIALSLSFFGTFVGVKWGTLICTLANGFLIGRISYILERRFNFKDLLPLREKIR